ncbi:MAG: bifunctional folylpolyglutamate synthase/dihydrofolate synthase [Bacteroidales bacterium]|nr:bifunctional folylpolyglutamate synthase/dihydrofolate synthase [Bacteroidales bacterium]
MTYLETQQWLYKQLPVFHRIGAAAYKIDISNTVDLLSSIGNPHHYFNSIHVAGTNGKGSSSHLIASILKESGKKIGLHTSPHLKDLRERVVVDGKMCSKNYVIRFVKKFKQRLGNVEPSFFELMVAMAFDYFRNKKVETAVVEVGMGGRLDSTNVLSPDCCLITNISFDHQQFLGSTLEQIASEKAGIIKENTPVVISQTQKETKPVFIKKAAEMNAPIFFAEDNYSIKNSRYEDGYLVVDVYRKKEIYLKDLQCPLCGEYQQKNLLGVIQLVEVLNTLGYKITKKNLRDGIGNVQQNFLLQGRWQKLSDNPYTLCDTGHNEDGLTHVVYQLNSIKKNRLNFVLGVVNDKDIDAEIEMLPKDAYYFLCKANIPRGLDVEILANKFAKRKMNYSVFPSVIQAYKEAQRDAIKTNAMVFVGGSTYTVAEVLSEIQR